MHEATVRWEAFEELKKGTNRVISRFSLIGLQPTSGSNPANQKLRVAFDGDPRRESGSRKAAYKFVSSFIPASSVFPSHPLH